MKSLWVGRCNLSSRICWARSSWLVRMCLSKYMFRLDLTSINTVKFSNPTACTQWLPRPSSSLTSPQARTWPPASPKPSTECKTPNWTNLHRSTTNQKESRKRKPTDLIPMLTLTRPRSNFQQRPKALRSTNKRDLTRRSMPCPWSTKKMMTTKKMKSLSRTSTTTSTMKWWRRSRKVQVGSHQVRMHSLYRLAVDSKEQRVLRAVRVDRTTTMTPRKTWRHCSIIAE